MYLDLLEYVLRLLWVVMERVLPTPGDKAERLGMLLVDKRLLLATLRNNKFLENRISA